MDVENELVIEIYESATKLSGYQPVRYTKGKQQMEVNIPTLNMLPFVLNNMASDVEGDELIQLIKEIEVLHSLKIKFLMQ